MKGGIDMYYPPYPSPAPTPVRNQQENGKKRVMTVTGVGSVSAQPNVAKINLGVETQDEELTKAQQDNAQTLNKVIDSLVQMGIPREDIQTVDYFIYPQYDYVDGKQEFRGYQVTHTIQVTIKDLSQTGKVIDTAVQNGANRVSNIEFTIDNPQQYYKRALNRALENAVSKAKTIADQMNLNLDPTPTQIVEELPQGTVTPQTFKQAEAVSSASTQVEPGQIEITARIETKFQYTSSNG